MSYENIHKLIRLATLVLNKLILNDQHFGKEVPEEVRLRKMGVVDSKRRDPFVMFREFVGHIRG